MYICFDVTRLVSFMVIQWSTFLFPLTYSTTIINTTIIVTIPTLPPLSSRLELLDPCAWVGPVLVAWGSVPLAVSEVLVLASAPKPDESAAPNPGTDANAIVLAPTTTSELPSDITVPETVTALLPWKTSVPAIARPRG